MWLRLNERCGGKLHHRDVVGAALRRLERDMEGRPGEDAVEDLIREMRLHDPLKPEPENNGHVDDPRARKLP